MLLAKTLRSSTFRRALLAILTFGALVIALFSYVYYSATNYVFARMDRASEAEISTLIGAFDNDGEIGLRSMIETRMSGTGLMGARYLLADQAYRPMIGNLPAWPSAQLDTQETSEMITARIEDTPGRSLLMRAKVRTLPDGTHLLVGRTDDDLAQFMDNMKTAFAATLALICGLSILASITITQRTVGRIESINATSREIMNRGLGTRIPLRGTKDEWDQLAVNLNSMLDRIELLMGEVKQVTENVAHDLRTPLTRLRGRLETAFNSPPDQEIDRSVIGDALVDLDNVLRMFSSLMRIAQIETSERQAAFEAVDLARLAEDVSELFEPLAEENEARIEVAGDSHVEVKGDRGLLFDAVSNLVDNAVKYGHPGGLVLISTMQRPDGAVLSVADDGPGIPDTESRRVFKRFYRLEKSRGTPGFGLGLSLVDAVVRMHGARLNMIDREPGLEVVIHFPTVRPAG